MEVDLSAVPSTVQMSGVRALVTRTLHLHVTGGPDAGRRFEGLIPPFTIGSGEGAQVRLTDPFVSRIHAEVEAGVGGATIVDRSSTNGTHLGPHRVVRAFLADGDRLRVGETTLEVRASPEAQLMPMSERRRFGGLLGDSPRMRALFAVLERLSRVDTPVLVRGETGAGKELVAQALHAEGRRASGPFVVFDCGSVAPSLIESELFGHRKGAFTGADQDRRGAFVEADGGTLFLDEIGELPVGLQPKLLRALEGRRVKALGAEREREVDVRVVAATHRDLSAMVNEGTFREDLYFRLAVFPIEVPPLRERREDLGVLAHYFLARALEGLVEGPVRPPDAETIAVLERLELRGNVRELRNLIERSVVLSDLEEARSGRLARAVRSSVAMGRRAEAAPIGLEEAKRAFERSYLVGLVRRHGRDRQAAAVEAGIHPKSLGRLLRKHGLTELDPDRDDPLPV